MTAMRIYLIGLASLLFTFNALAEDKALTITVKNVDAVKLSVPEDAKISNKAEKTTIETKTLWLYIWPVAGAKTVDEAIPKIGEVIKGEFCDFAAQSTESISLVGGAAKHLEGRGTEADDGDPGTAEVVVFAVSGNVFAACVHGEGDHAALERAQMLAVLQTAKAP